ncbi:Enoyl-CoA delta isomerase 2, mitochondrial [Apophysomyces sp. BC1021]|nr:Enoyl-CoA delta isomerase 2, mitochondrial [Apophysomyces sp. BC1021]
MSAEQIPKFKTLEITLSATGVAELAFNQPKLYNALTPEAYRDWLAAITWAANNDAVKVTVLTGRGKYYTSGQKLELPNFSDDNLLETLNRRREVTKNVVAQMIQFPKLLIAAINGPSIGFGTTTMALCDVIYSVPHATFTTPFMKLGFCAEGGSSVLFPRIMGPSKANEMLLLISLAQLMGRTFTAEEMRDCGMISRLISAENFRETVLGYAEEAAKFSLEAMKVTKELVRRVDREILLQANEEEIERLAERMSSQDSLESIMRFVEEAQKRKASKKSKL